MDTMTYLTYKIAGLPRNRVIGMGGTLDTARFKCYLGKALNANQNEIEGFVIGAHGDTSMIPLVRYAAYKCRPVTDLLDKETLDKVVSDTMLGGATITSLLGTSAWYAPGAAAAFLVEAIIHDEKKIIPCSVYLEGEYGQNDICIGVPVLIGRNGVEEILDYHLNSEEKELFIKSSESLRATNAMLKDLGVI